MQCTPHFPLASHPIALSRQGRPLSIQKFGCVRLPDMIGEGGCGMTLDSIVRFQTLHTELLSRLCGEGEGSIHPMPDHRL